MSLFHPPLTGLIDTHSHLLPGVDDGCKTVEDSIRCGHMLVQAGYSQAFCTPHIWQNLPNNSAANIARRVADLQRAFDAAGVALQLIPGGEHNFTELQRLDDPRQIITYGHATRYVLGDMWVDALPAYFWERVRWLQDAGFTVILAHPERMRAIQDDPTAPDLLAKAGILLQGNLQCFGDPPSSATRRTAEQFLKEDRYFMVGSDTHNPESLPIRLRGLERVQELATLDTAHRLLIDNPRTLIPQHPTAG